MCSHRFEGHKSESKGEKDTQKSLCDIGKHIFGEDVPLCTIQSDLDIQFVACGLKLLNKIDIMLDICASGKKHEKTKFGYQIKGKCLF